MKRWLIFGLLVLGLAALPYSCAAPPLLITGVKTMESDFLYLSWTTNIDAQCLVVECKGGQCSTPNGREIEWSTSHLYKAPLDVGLKIVAFDRAGNEVHLEVK